VAKQPPHSDAELPHELANVTPPKDLYATSDIRFVMTEVAKLQTQHTYVEKELGEARADMKDVRDRLARLETRVDHLPGKGFMVAVVVATLAITSGIVTVAPKLQSVFGNVASVAPLPAPAAATRQTP
jgi:hypothetical protein